MTYLPALGLAESVTAEVVDVDDVPMSALVCQAPEPKAVVLALHGGAANSTYFDYPGLPRLSLLRTAASLGFTAIALDRPGYGSSAEHIAKRTSVPERVDLTHAAVDHLLASRPRGAGVFVVAHSIGCELAMRMAAGGRGSTLLGVEIAGTGRRHHALALEILDAAQGTRRMGGLLKLLWQPEELYPADAVGGARMAAPAPLYEAELVRQWAEHDFPALAARVRVPVRYSLGDHEQVWQSGAAALTDVAAMFTASPRVVADEQADAGHNLSLCRTALAYHLKVLSFVEECVLARERAQHRGEE